MGAEGGEGRDLRTGKDGWSSGVKKGVVFLKDFFWGDIFFEKTHTFFK